MKVKQVESIHYYREYDSIERFASYYKQIKYILQCNPSNVLEIGSGHGLVADYLRRRNVEIINTDIDINLTPLLVSALPCLPFCDKSFDVVLCAEVIEHLPLNTVDHALAELARVTKNYLIISVPNASPYLKIFVRFTKKIKPIKILIPFRNIIGYEHKYDGEHYWELGKKGTTLRAVRKRLHQYYNLIDEERLFENPYHHFFLLEAR